MNGGTSEAERPRLDRQPAMTIGRFLREGRRVRVAIPPVVGSDFNDVLNSAAPPHLEGESRDVA